MAYQKEKEQSANCYGGNGVMDDRGCCEHGLKEKSRRTVKNVGFSVKQQSNYACKQWRASITLADNSYSGSFIIVPKHNDMIAEDAFSFACQHSIDLIDIK